MPYEDSVQGTSDVPENNESPETPEVSVDNPDIGDSPVVEESESVIEPDSVEESESVPAETVIESETVPAETENMESSVEGEEALPMEEESAGLQVSGNDIPEEGEKEAVSSVSGNMFPYDMDNPLPVYVVEETIPLSTYETNFFQVSDYWKSYFRGVLEKHPGKDYVAFGMRTETDTAHYYLYIGDLEESEGIITGTGLLRYDAYVRDDVYRVAVSNDALELDALGYAVYSNLGDFSELKEGGSYVLSFAILFALCFFVVFGVCRDIFQYILEHVYRK